MGAVIGEFLPFAIGIAISPLPIIVVILTLLSPRARTSSAGFLLGWLIGILAVIAVLTAASSILPDRADSEPSVWSGILKLVLGALLLLLALKQWRKRPHGDATPELPGWMKKVDALRFGGGIRLGLFLSVVNPKNVILSTSVGVDLGTSDLDFGALAVATAVFTLVAASTVLVPVIAYAIAAARLRAPLEFLHAWLTRENHTIMGVLFVVLGFVTLGKGIGILWP
ncbi:hypothetical protein GCM10027421_24750 [Microbacterium shaanxiense]